MNCGPLSRKKRVRRGYGLRCAERAVKWSPMSLGIAAKPPVAVYGRLFHPPIVQGTASPIFWGAYQAVIPEEQHTAAGKETGETAHVERWNNTLRQRLARFVRKTLSFSKSLVMHDAV